MKEVLANGDYEAGLREGMQADFALIVGPEAVFASLPELNVKASGGKGGGRRTPEEDQRHMERGSRAHEGTVSAYKTFKETPQSQRTGYESHPGMDDNTAT